MLLTDWRTWIIEQLFSDKKARTCLSHRLIFWNAWITSFSVEHNSDETRTVVFTFARRDSVSKQEKNSNSKSNWRCSKSLSKLHLWRCLGKLNQIQYNWLMLYKWSRKACLSLTKFYKPEPCRCLSLCVSHWVRAFWSGWEYRVENAPWDWEHEGVGERSGTWFALGGRRGKSRGGKEPSVNPEWQSGSCT